MSLLLTVCAILNYVLNYNSKIKDKVNNALKEVSDRDNAHYFPSLDYLHGKIKLVDAKERSASPNDKISIDTSNTNVEIDNTTKHSPDKKTCLACLNGDKSSGAHVCIICKLVHALKSCSVAFGYGQKRIYMFYSKSSQKILALWKVENWRGLNSEKETIRTAR